MRFEPKRQQNAKQAQKACLSVAVKTTQSDKALIRTQTRPGDRKYFLAGLVRESRLVARQRVVEPQRSVPPEGPRPPQCAAGTLSSAMRRLAEFRSMPPVRVAAPPLRGTTRLRPTRADCGSWLGGPPLGASSSARPASPPLGWRRLAALATAANRLDAGPPLEGALVGWSSPPHPLQAKPTRCGGAPPADQRGRRTSRPTRRQRHPAHRAAVKAPTEPEETQTLSSLPWQ